MVNSTTEDEKSEPISHGFGGYFPRYVMWGSAATFCICDICGGLPAAPQAISPTRYQAVPFGNFPSEPLYGTMGTVYVDIAQTGGISLFATEPLTDIVQHGYGVLASYLDEIASPVPFAADSRGPRVTGRRLPSVSAPAVFIDFDDEDQAGPFRPRIMGGWYQIVDVQTLEQCDLLPKVPVLTITNASVPPDNAWRPEVEPVYTDLMVLSQSCDLDRPTFTTVLLARYQSWTQIVQAGQGRETRIGAVSCVRGMWAARLCYRHTPKRIWNWTGR